MRPVQRAGTSLVELLAAAVTAEPAVILRRALAPFRNGRRAAPDAFRQPALPRRGPIIPTRGETDQSRLARALTEPDFVDGPKTGLGHASNLDRRTYSPGRRLPGVLSAQPTRAVAIVAS